MNFEPERPPIKPAKWLNLSLHQAPAFWRYGFAFLMALLALGTSLVLKTFFSSLPFGVLYPLVFATVAIAGFGPSILVTVMASSGSALFIIDPDLGSRSHIAYLKLLIFISASILLSLLFRRNQRLETQMTSDLISRREAELERTRLYTLMMDAPVIISITRGPNHVIEMVNRQASKKNPRPQVLGLALADVMPEIKSQGFIDKMDIVYQTGRPFFQSEARCDLLDPDGELKTYYFNLAYQPWREPSGEIAGVAAFSVDVTGQVLSRRQTEAIEQRLTLAMQASNQASWEIDLTTGSITGTPTLWDFFGVSATEAGNLKHSEMLRSLHPDDQIAQKRIMEDAIAKGVDYSNEYRVIWPDGSIHWIAAQGRILRDGFGRPVRMVGISHDRTEKKNMELELRRAKEEAEKANRLKSVFLANMSHEIRTPLAAILGFTDLLKDKKLKTPDRDRYIDIMSRNGHQLFNVINDILDLSKVEAGHLKLETAATQPQKIVQEVFSLLSLSAHAKNLKLELTVADTTPETLQTDPIRLKQILLNIVGNSVKFTSQGFVRVHLCARNPEAGKSELVINISDSGIGIPEAQREAVFESFAQADNSMTRKFGGTGLGLPLSRRLAEIMGGSLTLLESQENKGTAFEVALPFSGSKVSAGTEVSESFESRLHMVRNEPPQAIKILIVEDSPDNRELLKIYLAQAQLRADFCENGEEGMVRANEGFYDLILMDIQMPVLDGYEATRRLRQAGYTRPIVALTAHALSEFRKKGLEAGFDDYLTKPIHRPDLLKTIARFSPDSRPETPPDSPSVV